MEVKLKVISPDGVGAAMSKAELYRLLNEPEEAESICHDVLAVEPEHQLALRLLGLAITDQFTGDPSDRHSDVEYAFQRLTDRYERLYYMGILHERRAKAQLRAGRPPHTLIVLLDGKVSPSRLAISRSSRWSCRSPPSSRSFWIITGRCGTLALTFSRCM
jgi:hypothetical protein